MPSSPNPSILLLTLTLTLTLLLLLPLARSEDFICPAPSTGSARSCPINCFRPDPVCGVDGVTYWCGCPEADCAGARVAKRGFCQVGNGGAGKFSGQAFLLLHIVWLIVLGFSVLCGFL